jgi:hypothetical protein
VSFDLFVYQLAVNPKTSLGYALKVIQAAKHSAFARTAGSDDAQNLALHYFNIYIIQYFKLTEAFIDVFKLNHNAHSRHPYS